MPTHQPQPGERRVVVVLHDVAPARWAACERVLAQLRAIAHEAGAALPVSLLVVPQLHGDPATPKFVRWLHRQLRQGCEPVLHGWTHRDDTAARGGDWWRRWLDHALRRWYTAGEGEFAALDHAAAAHLLARGTAWAVHQRLPVTGFVAPAWLLSPAALDAVADAGFAYTCTLTQIVLLPGRQALHARSIVFSTRSWWRRVLSVVWNSLLGVWQHDAPLLRFELHPHDADHPWVLACWRRLLRNALRGRRAVLLADAAAALATPAGTPNAAAAR